MLRTYHEALTIYAACMLSSRVSGLQVGTFAWAAPEVLLGQQCSEKVDIYSYGVLMWELSAGEAPIGRQLRKLRYAMQPLPSQLAALCLLLPQQMRKGRRLKADQ